MDSLSKSDIVEVKSFKSAPRALQQVSEATCLLFSTKPSYDNFKRLMNKGDFIQMLKNYDKDNISDYAVNQLTQYIDDKDFTPQYMGRISRFGSVLCLYIRAMYDYSNIKTLV